MLFLETLLHTLCKILLACCSFLQDKVTDHCAMFRPPIMDTLRVLFKFILLKREARQSFQLVPQCWFKWIKTIAAYFKGIEQHFLVCHFAELIGHLQEKMQQQHNIGSCWQLTVLQSPTMEPFAIPHAP